MTLKLLILTAILSASLYNPRQAEAFNPATRIIVPNSLQGGLEGNAFDAWPFSQIGAGRFLQVFASNQFSLISTGGGQIVGIRFRLDGSASMFEQTTLNYVHIYLSTTERQPDNLSLIFAENAGRDYEHVKTFSGRFNIEKDFQPPAQPFAIQFLFDRPFFYHPGEGNLLVDIRSSGSTLEDTLFPLDAQDEMGDSISSVWGSDGPAEGFLQSRGYVIQFVTEPIGMEPVLSVEVSLSEITVKWPLYGSNYVLQSASSLVNSKWQTMVQVPQQQGANYVQQFALTNNHRFFRLIH